MIKNNDSDNDNKKYSHNTAQGEADAMIRANDSLSSFSSSSSSSTTILPLSTSQPGNPTRNKQPKCKSRTNRILMGIVLAIFMLSIQQIALLSHLGSLEHSLYSHDTVNHASLLGKYDQITTTTANAKVDKEMQTTPSSSL